MTTANIFPEIVTIRRGDVLSVVSVHYTMTFGDGTRTDRAIDVEEWSVTAKAQMMIDSFADLQNVAFAYVSAKTGLVVRGNVIK